MLNQLLFFIVFCGVIAYLLLKIRDDTHNKPNWIRFYYKYLIFFLSCFISSILILPVCFIRPKNVLNARYMALIAYFLTNIFLKDLKYEVQGGDILSVDRAAVIISNHQTLFDILGMINTWQRLNKLIVVSKKEIFYMWPFGLAMYLSGMVYINRRDSNNSYQQLNELSKLFIKEKIKIWVYPEGTRNKNHKSHLLKFKKGAFNMAVSAQVPIIPVVFSPYYFIEEKNHIFNKGRVIMKCLDPIPTAGLTMDDVPELANRLWQIMSDTYRDLSNEIDVSKHNNTILK